MDNVRNFFNKVFVEYKCYVTFLLIAINLFVFAGMFLETGDLSFDGMYVYEKGGMVIEYADDGELHRLVTAMFLHFDFEHIASNMLMLAVIGSIIERVVGSGTFAVVYLLGGILGNVFSAHMHAMKNQAVIAAGASGAIFAIAGALIFLFLINRNRLEEMTAQRLGAFVLLMLYQCFGSEGVDNYAHLGGLVSGFIIAAILIVIKNEMRNHVM